MVQAFKIPKFRIQSIAGMTKTAQELNTLRALALNPHENFFKIYDIVDTKHTVYYFRENIVVKSLSDLMQSRTFGYTSKLKIFTQLIRAIHHLHSLGICHKGISFDGLYLTSQGVLKISRFSDSTQAKPGEMLKGRAKFGPFAAPEVFKDHPYSGQKADVWSCGILLLQLFINEPKSQSLGDLYLTVAIKKSWQLKKFPSWLEKLRRTMLSLDPKKRPSMEEILEFLEYLTVSG